MAQNIFYVFAKKFQIYCIPLRCKKMCVSKKLKEKSSFSLREQKISSISSSGKKGGMKMWIYGTVLRFPRISLILQAWFCQFRTKEG
jgi:hypothetical protein